MPAKSRLGVSANMTANYYSGASTLTFTVDGVALNAAEISRLVKITSSTGSFMGMNKKASPKYLSVSGSGTAAINGSAVKITFSWKCDYSTASEYSFACDGIFARNPFRYEIKVDLENPRLGYNRHSLLLSLLTERRCTIIQPPGTIASWQRTTQFIN